MYRKPIILITVHRRYYELNRTIENIEKLKEEFASPPIIVVVWACPEIGRLWFFQELLKQGKIDRLVYREATEFDNNNGPTSYPASLNIRVGLDFIKREYSLFNYYVIGHDADIVPNTGTFKYIDQEMQDFNKDGVLFFWENGIRHVDTWHTNFFAVSSNKNYWPPISDRGGDVLESQWGTELLNNNLRNFTVSHNSRSQKFLHIHSTETEPSFPFKPQVESEGVFIYIKGRVSIWTRLKNLIWRILWQR